MLSEPKIEHRNEKPYLSIRKTIHQSEISDILPPLIPEVKSWIEQRNLEIAGPDFFLYKSMNDQGMMNCEAGFTIRQAIQGDDRVSSGIFPAGIYASIIYTGHFKDMIQGHMALENWIKEQGLKEKAHVSAHQTDWGGRAEFYLVDPDLEPDPDQWQTEIVFQLED